MNGKEGKGGKKSLNDDSKDFLLMSRSCFETSQILLSLQMKVMLLNVEHAGALELGSVEML